MEKDVLLRFYLKAGLCAATALVLSIVAAFYLKTFQMVLFGLAIVLWYLHTAYSVHRKAQNGEIVSVYAKCIDIEEQTWLEKKTKRNPLYRFLAVCADETGRPEAPAEESEEEGEVSLFLRAPVRRFRPGELYCLLFRKTEDSRYNEQMLIAYGAVPANPMEFAVVENGSRDAQTEAESILDDDDFSDDPEIKSESGNAIRVDFRNS